MDGRLLRGCGAGGDENLLEAQFRPKAAVWGMNREWQKLCSLLS